MITTGAMRLPQPESLDDLDAFLRGLEADGGYWEAMRRLADHDHSGGLLGAPVALEPERARREAAVTAAVAPVLERLAALEERVRELEAERR